MPQNASAFQRRSIGFIYFGAALLVFLSLWQGSRPQTIVDLESDRVRCLSYSPPAERPIYLQPVTIEQIRRDLKLLQPYTECVRTYSVDNGLEHVPAVARELGLHVLLGAWIGRDLDQNQLEVDRLVQLANEYDDVVRAVIVGNEVLLRREQPAEALRNYLRAVRIRTNVSVTYADVWEFWLQHRDIAEDVSFVTVHMLPYWEDHPVPIENAVGHITHVYGIVKDAFPQHEIFIGEAGWPSEGRQRAGACHRA